MIIGLMLSNRHSTLFDPTLSALKLVSWKVGMVQTEVLPTKQIYSDLYLLEFFIFQSLKSTRSKIKIEFPLNGTAFEYFE